MSTGLKEKPLANERANEVLKERVREYWNTHPCGTQFTDLEWGSRAFFDEVERFRYRVQPFMHTMIGFDRYADKDLLEIGCGLGTDLLQFARGGARVTGIDLTPASIDLVKRRFQLYGLPVDARVADAEDLPFEDGRFDVVYSFGVLHHTPNTQRAIDEVHRVLKPGGECIVMLYHRRSLYTMVGTPLYAIARHLGGSRGEGSETAELHAGSTVEDWVRRYDGAANPLGKAYTRAEARSMFRIFNDLRIQCCDPIRRNVPTLLNRLNQRVFASRFGFYMIIRGTK
jgi:SAM-dependent methyltransferase